MHPVIKEAIYTLVTILWKVHELTLVKVCQLLRVLRCISHPLESARYEVYWEGYVDGVKLYESEHSKNTNGNGWINVDWEVDYVKFVASWDNTGFLVDNIKLTH